MFLDQSSNQLVRTHYLGRDGFVWWLGQIALPDTSKSNTQDLSARKKDQTLYYNRVKVRIFGYHTANGGELPDVDLPWAHILVPPGVANGSLGEGTSHEYVGGETVFGFFLDGDDGQQPVIVGSLYKGSGIQNLQTLTQVKTNKSTKFLPTLPSGKRGNHTIRVGGETLGGQNVRTGVGSTTNTGVNPKKGTCGIDDKARYIPEDTDKATAKFCLATDKVSIPPNPCKEDEVSKITSALEDFMKRMQGYQAYLNLYVGGVANKLGTIASDIREIGMLIAGLITGLFKRGMKYIFDEVSKKLQGLISILFPKPKQSAAQQKVRTLLTTIYCLFKKFIKKIFSYVINQLQSMVGQVLNAASCVVDNFVGQMLGDLFNSFANAIGPTLDQLSNFLGGALGKANEIMSKALNVAGFIRSLFDCEKRNCTPPQKFTTRYGPSQQEIDNFNKIMNKAGAAGARSLIDDLKKKNPDLFGDVDFGFGGCNGDILRCGPPSIQILGGGGSGASAQAIVNNLGQVIGANILNTGQAYFELPYVSIIDSCGKGQNARARAVLDNGGVTRIIIDDPGYGYLNNQTTQQYGSEEVSIPSDGNNDINSTSYVTVIDGVEIDDIGSGYDENTAIVVIPGDNDIGVVDLPEFELQFGPNGSIVGVNVTNKGGGFTQIPEIQVVSLDGAGASLKPVFRFVEVNKEDAGEFGVGRVLNVVDCVQR